MEDRIIKVLDHIEENLGTSLELKDLAAVACLSPSQFHRQFKHQTGRTPFRFVEELKMNKAYHLILQENWMIHELSDRFGYKDFETFSRAFKKYFHFSPDDLKAIVERLKVNVGPGEEHELMIVTQDESKGDDDLLKQLKEIIKERNLKMTDLERPRIFKISPKASIPEKNGHLIKNKFALTTQEKLWKALLE